jgi:hypothetical protein
VKQGACSGRRASHLGQHTAAMNDNWVGGTPVLLCYTQMGTRRSWLLGRNLGPSSYGLQWVPMSGSGWEGRASNDMRKERKWRDCGEVLGRWCLGKNPARVCFDVTPSV